MSNIAMPFSKNIEVSFRLVGLDIGGFHHGFFFLEDSPSPFMDHRYMTLEQNTLPQASL
jgi:hypothetical protein